MDKIKIGDVLWRMNGYRKSWENETEWHAVPVCVEYVDEHKFLDAYKCGGSLNSIGKNYFRSRAECLQDWEKHNKDYKETVSTAIFHEERKMGSVAKDDIAFCRGEDILRVFQNETKVPLNTLPWKLCEDVYQGEPDYYITLGEIREALGKGILTVWYEGPLMGYIYQTGNYPRENAWRVHGRTQGYA